MGDVGGDGEMVAERMVPLLAWIESHQSLLNHPKTLAASAILKIDKVKLIGHLHCLWWWALDVADVDGKFPPRCTAQVIAQGALWRGKAEVFISALCDAGFIDEDDQSQRLHDWYEYAGKLNAKRAANKERMKEKRAGHVQDTTDARAAHVQGLPTQHTQPTNSRVEGSLSNNVPSNGIRDPVARVLLDLSGSEVSVVRERFPQADINGLWREWKTWVQKSKTEPPEDKVAAFCGFVAKKYYLPPPATR